MWTADHVELDRSLRTLIARDITPFVDQWERDGAFPAHDLFRTLGAAGFLGVTKPVEFGGAGLNYSFGLAMAEIIGEIGCGGVPLAIGVQTDMATPALAKFGSDSLRAEFLAPAISGEAVACIGVSEPHAGSDVAAIRTYARTDGDDYVISGTKMWITNGAQADWMCLLAVTDPDGPRHRNKSLICVPLGAPGVSRSPPLDKLGMRSSDTAQIFFDEVRVPRANRIGEEGQGFRYQMEQFQEERLWGAASVLRAMDGAIARTRDYVSERAAFGGTLGDFQVIRYRLCELETEIEALRSLTYRAVEQYVGGQNVTRLATMAKLKAGRLAREMADACLQYWGGAGYLWDSPVARLYRDLRLLSIGGGADEVMLQILSRLPQPESRH